MSLWLSEIPSAASFAMLFVLWNVLALGAMAIARHWLSRSGLTSGPAVVSAWATCAGGLCALLFAFSVVTLWNQNVRAGSNVDDEASAMRLAARDIAPAQVPLLRSYVLQTLVEWPNMCGGEENPDVQALLVRIEREAQPRSEKYADNLFQVLGTLEDMRNRRWQLAQASVPTEIWIGLLVLSVSLLVVLAIAMPEQLGTHVALMLAVGTSIGTLFWVTTVLEYPFCGAGGLSPSEIVVILRTHVF